MRWKAWRAIVPVGLALFLIAGCDEKSKMQREVERELFAVTFLREVADGGYGVITTAELRELLDSETERILVDAGPSARTYDQGHIPGARYFMFPPQEMKDWDTKLTEGRTLEEYTELLGADRKTLVVVYSGFVKCRRSHNAARFAVEQGFENVKRYPGGLYAWKGSDFPLEETEEE